MVWTLKYQGDMATSSSGIGYYWLHNAGGRVGGKSIPAQCSVSIEVKLPFTFRFDRESKSRKLAKWFGFNSKFQTGDKTFDDVVFVDADDPLLCECLVRNPIFRQIILELFSNNAAAVYMKDEILWVDWIKGYDTPPDEMLEKQLHALLQIKKLLATLRQPEERLYRSWRRTLAVTLKIIFVISLFVGVMAWAALVVIVPNIVETRPLYFLVAKVTAAIVLGLLVLIKLCFARSPYGYDALGALFVYGVYSTVLCSSFAIVWMDIYYDSSAPRTVSATVRGKFISNWNRRVNYVVILEDWSDLHKTYNLNIGSAEYDAMKPGKSIIKLDVHPGYLGYEWIGQYKVVE